MSFSTLFEESKSCIETSNEDLVIAVFILGGPGAGKGTQCKKICEKYSDIITLSTGQLLRNFVKSGTKDALKISKQMSEGKLVEINATEQLLKPEFEKYGSDKVYLIDGFPRDITILNDWQNSMEDKSYVPFIIEFVCDNDTLKKRLLSREMSENKNTKRMDNNVKAIQNRISLFENETQKVIDYFKKEGKYRTIDATQDVNKVFQSFCDLIEPIRTSFIDNTNNINNSNTNIEMLAYDLNTKMIISNNTSNNDSSIIDDNNNNAEIESIESEEASILSANDTNQENTIDYNIKSNQFEIDEKNSSNEINFVIL